LRNKFISLINIGGLAIGMATFMIIAIYVSYELSYDDFFKDKDRIFRYAEYLKASSEEDFRLRNTIGSERKKHLVQLSGIESVARIVHHPGIFIPSAVVSYFKADDTRRYAFDETDIFTAEQSFLDIFGFPFIHGEPNSALKDMYAVVISKSTALKYFNHTSGDLIGKTLYISQASEKIKDSFKITGIFEDLPANSHFAFDILLSYTTYSANIPGQFEDDYHFYYHTYIKLTKDYELDLLKKEMPDFNNSNLAQFYKITKEEYIKNKEGYYQSRSEIQPLNSIYLTSPGDREFSSHGNMLNLYMLAGIALVILLIAWVNYINLSLVQLMSRAKEVGVRKVIGASKRSIATQFLLETFNANLISIVISVTIIPIIIPPLSEFLGKDLDIAIWYNGHPNVFLFWGILAFVLLISALITGLYPAMVFSNTQPAVILKSFVHGLGRIFAPKKKLNNGFVLVQFSAVYVLIAITLGTFLQLNY
ncbi:MAG: ABC transporter permease, partial [Cyclobacteriaceae bacterium]|nr:ABC transporter permease [Cyclobacteriaceae bacterium]